MDDACCIINRIKKSRDHLSAKNISAVLSAGVCSLQIQNNWATETYLLAVFKKKTT